jgi:probable phosphoglycerate mutase
VTTLFLIRHGLTAQTGKILYGQLPGVPLDRRGRAQAQQLAERLSPVRLTAIYTSPLERCVQTVEPLALAAGLPLRPRAELIEMDAGAWTGRRLAQLRRLKDWKVVKCSPSGFAFPGGEGFTEAEVRVWGELQRIARRHRGGRVAVATHGDLVRIALSKATGVGLDGFQRFVADAASVSVIEMDGRGQPRVLLMNDTGGLERFAKDPVPPWEDGRSGGKLRG